MDDPFLINIKKRDHGRKNMNAIIKINRPELTAEERAKRMEEIRKAATQLLIAAEKNKRVKR